jgi:probable selenium-dependent hydroxylase accessory protein YqeC
MRLEEAFGLQEREVVSLAGGGGKTTLLFALAAELSSYRRGIILTTTTKIWEPAPSPSFALFLSTQLLEMIHWISNRLGSCPYLIVAREKLSDGKLRGIPPEWVEKLASVPGVSILLVEADGAAGRSLKAPREDEPVLPENTSLLIPVMGIDALGCPLDDRHVFRAELAARLLHLQPGQEVTPEIIARLLALIVKKLPSGARVIPFINKADLPGLLEKGRSLARFLTTCEPLRAARVVLGNAALSPSAIEIFETSKPPRLRSEDSSSNPQSET